MIQYGLMKQGFIIFIINFVPVMIYSSFFSFTPVDNFPIRLPEVKDKPPYYGVFIYSEYYFQLIYFARWQR